MSNPNRPSAGSFIERRTITIPAGNVVLPVNVFGRVFACTDASGAFEMSFNSGPWFACGKGVEWALNGDDRFHSLSFRATAATDVSFYAGAFFYHQNVVVPVMQIAKTKVVTSAINSLAGSASIAFTTVPAGCSYRKAICITNDDPAVDLLIQSDDPTAPGTWASAGTVFFKQVWYMETSDRLKVANLSAGVVPCKIFEIFYLA